MKNGLRSNVEYYSPVMGYVYKLVDDELYFLDRKGRTVKSSVEIVSALQLRERVKLVVVGYSLVMNSGRFAGNFPKKDIHHALSLTTDFVTIKRINGKPVFRPIYKKD